MSVPPPRAEFAFPERRRPSTASSSDDRRPGSGAESLFRSSPWEIHKPSGDYLRKIHRRNSGGRIRIFGRRDSRECRSPVELPDARFAEDLRSSQGAGPLRHSSEMPAVISRDRRATFESDRRLRASAGVRVCDSPRVLNSIGLDASAVLDLLPAPIDRLRSVDPRPGPTTRACDADRSRPPGRLGRSSPPRAPSLAATRRFVYAVAGIGEPWAGAGGLHALRAILRPAGARNPSSRRLRHRERRVVGRGRKPRRELSRGAPPLRSDPSARSRFRALPPERTESIDAPREESR